MKNHKKQLAESAMEDERKYRAPALEKGLDILELLARNGSPMTTSQMAATLGRSVSELFRMVLALEYRGYIVASPEGREGYMLTNKLFTLGIAQGSARSLLEAALPAMKELSREVGQSCHLVVASGDQIVVVARIESATDLGFSVRVGYRRSLPQAASGAVLYAFQPEDIRRRWEKLLDPELSEAELEAFRAHADAVRQRHVELTPSRFVAGVTDISAPVMRGGMAAAALTVPYLKKLQPSLSPRETAVLVRQAADRISDQLVEGDSRI